MNTGAVVMAAAGKLRGTVDHTVTVFRGVPFAAPPVGPLRWRPPRPAPRWAGVRPAVAFGPAPPQPSPPPRSIMYRNNFADRRPPVFDEDCLYLNVWTPDPSPAAALPVLVFVHGGGNRYGHGSQDINNGATLSARGIVVVTLNHRLGALGFLAHPQLAAEDPDGACGNYALLDVLAALRWVQENIAAFGGDPGRVTLGGNSAGAAQVCHLMAAPSARGLFRAAVGQSAAGLGRAEGPLADQETACRAGKQLGGDLAALRGLSARDLAAAGHFGPIVDGRLLTEDTGAVFAAGRQAAVPLLAGSNADEGSVYAGPDAAARAGRHAATPGFTGAYPAGDERQARRSGRELVGDLRFVYPVWRWSRTHAGTSGAPAWHYRFTQAPPVPGDGSVQPPPDGLPGYGAFHTAELPYMTGNLHPGWSWTDRDRELSALMVDLWARFVATADPNGGGLPHWPSAGPAGPLQVLFLGARVTVGDFDRPAAMRVLDDLPRPM